MSSPLSTLRKTRRAPLPCSESGRERRVYKETTCEGSAPSNLELMSSMMQKLGQLERKLKAQALNIDSKARRIAVLEEKLRLLQEKKQGEKQEEEEGLARMCHKLQNQVWEMEEFLNDYGMIWVGSGEQHDIEDEMQPGHERPDSSGHLLWQPGASVVGRISVNFDQVLRNIQDLNILAGEGASYVTSIPGGARLSQRSSVPLWLFKNGIMMFDGPFRPYQDLSAQQFMQDLMDGYFPSELQRRFPDGVVFQIHDKRGEEFPAVRHGAEFPGRGHVVRGSDEQLEFHREEASNTLLDLSHIQFQGRKLSMEQFLKKLPKSVVKAGKVINIRSSLKTHLEGYADGAKIHSVTVVETPVLQALRESLESSNAGHLTSKTEFTTLRVKSEDGEKTFILKMLFSETIGHLRQYLDAHRGPGCSSYNIITAFPQHCYSDDTQTLLACGLTSNATLLLRPHQVTSLATTT
ncbi:UBX domain-containing protein 11 isoform X2 [Electrophorus electricus]|uniref:UBX domain-containing protein 11 n=1 Tax=Electrophorus electricus TaxID=8005 RepID=A0A4W4FFV5_ELEEL|nr:UBX domain-containing protein 11 isoform X2 [Electrophorus electricus]